MKNNKTTDLFAKHPIVSPLTFQFTPDVDKSPRRKPPSSFTMHHAFNYVAAAAAAPRQQQTDVSKKNATLTAAGPIKKCIRARVPRKKSTPLWSRPFAAAIDFLRLRCRLVAPTFFAAAAAAATAVGPDLRYVESRSGGTIDFSYNGRGAAFPHDGVPPSSSSSRRRRRLESFGSFAEGCWWWWWVEGRTLA